MKVKTWKRVDRDRSSIAAYLWKERNPGNAYEERATLLLVQGIFEAVDQAIEQLRKSPESGQARRERKRRLVIMEKYILYYQISKDGKRLSVTNLRHGARKPLP